MGNDRKVAPALDIKVGMRGAYECRPHAPHTPLQTRQNVPNRLDAASGRDWSRQQRGAAKQEPSHNERQWSWREPRATRNIIPLRLSPTHTSPNPSADPETPRIAPRTFASDLLLPKRQLTPFLPSPKRKERIPQREMVGVPKSLRCTGCKARKIKVRRPIAANQRMTSLMTNTHTPLG